MLVVHRIPAMYKFSELYQNLGPNIHRVWVECLKESAWMFPYNIAKNTLNKKQNLQNGMMVQRIHHQS